MRGGTLYVGFYEMDFHNVDYEDLLYHPNGTAMDSLAFLNTHPEATKTLVLGVLKILLSLIGVLANGLMICIILKYKNMRNSVNTYIMNWLIADAMFIVIDPVEYHLGAMLKYMTVEASHICLFFSLGLIIRTFSALFMLLMLLQWFFVNTSFDLFDKYCFMLVISVWTIGIVAVLVLSHSCLTTIYHTTVGDVFLALLVLVFIICLLIIHCKRRCRNPFSANSSLSIALITSFCLCWTIFTVIIICYAMYKDNTVLTCIYYIASFVIYVYPLLCMYLFYKIDKTFASCCRRFFGCNQDSNASFAAEEETLTIGETPQICDVEVKDATLSDNRV